MNDHLPNSFLLLNMIILFFFLFAHSQLFSLFRILNKRDNQILKKTRMGKSKNKSKNASLKYDEEEP